MAIIHYYFKSLNKYNIPSHFYNQHSIHIYALQIFDDSVKLTDKFTSGTGNKIKTKLTHILIG
jgi:hypothetical protein